MKEFDAASVINQYGKNILGEDTVFYPSSNPTRLVVLFSAMDVNNKFNRLSWFWDESETWLNGNSYLFLSDKEYSYYLGNDCNPKFHTYEKIILHYSKLCSVAPSETYCVGSSMGGYAAILFAFRMNLAAAIVGIPQISKSFTRMHSYANWFKNIKAMGDQWVDLDEFLYRPDMKLPKLYVEYGQYPADLFATEKLLDIYRNRGGLFIARKYEAKEHIYFMSKSVILSSIDFFCAN